MQCNLTVIVIVIVIVIVMTVITTTVQRNVTVMIFKPLDYLKDSFISQDEKSKTIINICSWIRVLLDIYFLQTRKKKLY